MNRLLSVLVVFLIISIPQIFAQGLFDRTTIINTVTYEGNGFGGIVGPVDLDADGKLEIYMCNTNTIDDPASVLIPRLYKFEWSGTEWEMVWSTEVLNIPKQNTWPGFTSGDLDKDGKLEIIWGPVNWIEAGNENPPRILIFEYPGDGSDNMGVFDGVGNYLPNTSFTITDQDNVNLRPSKFVIADVDNDGDDELIFNDRQSSTSNYHVGILSVSDVPDFADGTEEWLTEFSGSGDFNFDGTGNKWDVCALNNFVYVWGSDESIYPVKFTGSAYESLAPIAGTATGNSFMSSMVGDIDEDGTEEIVYGSWSAPAKVFLLQPNGDDITSTEIADFTSLGIQRIVYGKFGDLDNDGNVDFVFGTRYVDATTPNFATVRLSYLGGDITSPASYVTSIIDSGAVLGGESGIMTIANFDGDLDAEIILTASYPRGPAPNVIDVFYLDRPATSVELESSNIPSNFYVEQNYPNPFNPSTVIKFGITEATAVDLRVYDVLGREVAILVNNQNLEAGSYNATFNAEGLASGIYVYRIIAGNNTTSMKMQLLK